MKPLPTRLLPACILGCILWLQASACFAQNNLDIRLEDGLISINAEDVDLKLLLQDLAGQSGFKLWVSDQVESTPVSINIEKQPIEKILRRLLGESSYALVYDNNDVITALHVLPPGEAQPAIVKLEPESGDFRQQALQNALQSTGIPDTIKSALLNQFSINRDVEPQPLPIQPPLAIEPSQAIGRVIEMLENMGAANPEAMRQLREKIELEKNLQQE